MTRHLSRLFTGAVVWAAFLGGGPLGVQAGHAPISGHTGGSALAADIAVHHVPLFPAASNALGRQGFVRIVNRSGTAGTVDISAYDTVGTHHGPVALRIPEGRAAHFNSGDLENGNRDKGLDGATGAPGEGDWRLELRSTLDLEVLAYMRTRDGFLTSLHDLVPATGSVHDVVLFNPGENPNQVSRLRLINRGAETASVTVEGTDDRGVTPGGPVVLSLPGGAAREWKAHELESGEGEGLSGALGDGTGKWRLRLSSSVPIQVMSLLASPTGHLTNLSTLPVSGDGEEFRTGHGVPLFPSAARFMRESVQGFVRVINRSGHEGEVRIDAFDDEGTTYGPVTLNIGANEAVHFNSHDLENGNADKGLDGETGAPVGGNWRLELSSSLDIDVLAYIRTSDGFLTSMHDLVPRTNANRRVAIFNPGSNASQVSRLRLINRGDETASVTITGIDDKGNSPGTEVAVTVRGGGSRTFTSQELESGDHEELTGALGDGAGKWRLVVESDSHVDAMSLLTSPGGHMTNLSTGAVEAMADPRQISHYVLAGEELNAKTGWTMDLAGDVDCDGTEDILVGAPHRWNAAVFLVSAADLHRADAADGKSDRFVRLSHTARQGGSWKLHTIWNHETKLQATSIPDVDGDGCAELVVGVPGDFVFHPGAIGRAGAVYVVSGSDLEVADALDGASDREISFNEFIGQGIDDLPGSWRLLGESTNDAAGQTIASGDMNGDGRPELVIAAPKEGEDDNGAVYILSVDELKEKPSEVRLREIATLPNSWKLIGARGERNTGQSLASGDFDGDGRTDLVVHAQTSGAGEPDVLYLVSSKDLPHADAADGSRNGEIELETIAHQESSWRLTTSLRTKEIPAESILAMHDLTGDGVDEIGFAERTTDGGKGAVVFISSATLGSIRDAAGNSNRNISLARLESAEGWLRIIGDSNALTVWKGKDLNADGVPEIVVGEPGHVRPTDCADSVSPPANGAVHVLSGSALAAADLADGRRDSKVHLRNAMTLGSSRKIVGGPGWRLGATSFDMKDLDGDGDLEAGFGANLASLARIRPDLCSDLDGEGGVILVSASAMEDLDEADGEVDREINPESLVAGVECEGVSLPRATRQFSDNVVVMEMTGCIWADRIDFAMVAREVLAHYEDGFDYLFLISNLPSAGYDTRNYYGIYVDVQNQVHGIGKAQGRFGLFRDIYGSDARGRLTGMTHIPWLEGLILGPALHEIMHTWANFSVPSVRPSHWGFSSANGQLGGFDIDNLVNHGRGRYSAGRFGTFANGGNFVPYSPIELYFAGLVGPEEVPDLWVARDGAWTRERDDDGNAIFTSSRVETYTIERIIAENGARSPDHLTSQKSFRAALVLLVDDSFPGETGDLEWLSGAVRRFSHDGDDRASGYNFWEATGGRATLKMDALGALRKPTPERSVQSAGAPIEPSSGTNVGAAREVPGVVADDHPHDHDIIVDGVDDEAGWLTINRRSAPAGILRPAPAPVVR